MTQAWQILGDPKRRREYHEQLGLSEPPGETRRHESHATDEEAVLSEDTTSDKSTIICQDPELFLDEPFIEGRKSPLSQRTIKPRDSQIKTTGASAMPRMGTFWTRVEEGARSVPTSHGTITAEGFSSGDADTNLDVEEASTGDDSQLDATRNRARNDDMIRADGGAYPIRCKRPLPEDDDTEFEDEENSKSRGTKARCFIH